jgi:hypothetical protein
MSANEHAVQLIVAAFEHNAYPGDDYLLGSRQGCEPADEVLPFQGKLNWRNQLRIPGSALRRASLFHRSWPAFFSPRLPARRPSRRTAIRRTPLHGHLGIFRFSRGS